MGAAFGLGAIGPYVTKALAAGGGEDVETLNFLLPFEYLQAELYDRGRRRVNDKGKKMVVSAEQARMIASLLDDERRHVAAVTSMIRKLGGKPVPTASYAFAYREIEVFLQIAAELETSAIIAYNGVIPSLKSGEARELAGSIVQVEGRHAATVLIPRKEEPAPDAFDRGVSKYEAVASVEKFTGTY